MIFAIVSLILLASFKKGEPELNERSFNDTVKALILSETNKQRHVYGSSPVTMLPILSVTVEAHVSDMINRNYFSHSSPENTNPFQRLQAHMEGQRKKFGHSDNINFIGENLHKKRFHKLQDEICVAKVIVADFMMSDGHRASMIEPRFTHVGISVKSIKYSRKEHVVFVGMLFGD